MPRSAAVLVLLLCASAASAQIATYTFENTRAATTVAANATAAAAVYGPGLRTASFVTGQAGQGTSAAGYESAGSLNRAALSDYLDVTVTAGAGRVLLPGAFTFYARADAAGPKNIDVRTSADGFASNIGTPGSPSTTAFTSYSIDLSGATYQNRTTLSIRIYGYKASGAAGTLVLDGISVGGTVVTPVTEVATLVFNPTSASVVEGASGTARVQLGIVNDTGTAGLNTAVTATVTFDATSSTAVAADLGTVSGTVTFPVGSLNGAVRTVSIPTVDDTAFEGTENAPSRWRP